MAKVGKVRRVSSVVMELEMEEADALLLFLDKARTQMISDGSNTSDAMQILNQMELNLHNALQT